MTIALSNINDAYALRGSAKVKNAGHLNAEIQIDFVFLSYGQGGSKIGTKRPPVSLQPLILLWW